MDQILTLGFDWSHLGVVSLVILFLAVSGLLILAVLIQRAQGGGLSGAFGSGAGSGQTAFGAKTGDALTLVTIGMFTLYVILAISLNYAVRPAAAEPAPPDATSTSSDGSTPVEPSTTSGTGTSGETPAGVPSTDGQPAAAPQPAAPVEVTPADPAADQKPAESTPEATPPATTPPTETPGTPPSTPE